MKGTQDKERREQEELLEELFSHATRRERPPAEDERAIRESLHGQWKNMAGRRKRNQRIALAAAASLVLAIIVSGFLVQGPAAPEAGLDAASVERVQGRVSLHAGDSAAPTELEPGTQLVTAQAVSTAHGAGLALRWHNGILLRLDQNSRVVFTSPQSLELAAGRVYIDTEAVTDSGTGLELSTPAGPVRHVGTRYMVAVNLGTTSVSVREGRVSLGTDDTVASAGEKLFVNASGERRRERIAVYGDEWQWTEPLSEPMAPDGRSVSELLAWVGHETGRSVEYASSAVERLATETRLHGDIGLEPMQALELITQSTDLVTEVRDGKIMVDIAPAR